jgi:hypothetical protein
MMLNEQKYDSLIAEIEKNRNLVESDRFLFYELHKKVSKPNDFVLNRILIPELIHQMRYNDRMRLIEDEEKEIVNFLEKRRNKNIGQRENSNCYIIYIMLSLIISQVPLAFVFRPPDLSTKLPDLNVRSALSS